MPAWPAGLPDYHRTPPARCMLGDLELGEGTWLPRDRADALTDRLKACDDLPGLFRRQLGRIQGRVLPDIVDAAVDAAVARARRDWMLEQESGGFLAGLSLTVAIVVGVFAAGAVAGIVLMR